MGSDEVRRSAARVQLIGDDVRRLADQALAAAAVHWRSTAATGFRHRLAEEVNRVRASATALEAAAEALVRHAGALDASRPGGGEALFRPAGALEGARIGVGPGSRP